MGIEYKRAKGSEGENRNMLRSGVLTLHEKLMILQELGIIAQKKYNQNLFFGAGSYNLRFLMNSLYFAPDPFAFENEYWVDVGSAKGNEIANYFEYGTGIHNIKHKHMITPKHRKYMKFEGTFKWGGQVIFAKKVKGVRPILMFERTLKFIEHNRPYLQRRIRLRLGI